MYAARGCRFILTFKGTNQSSYAESMRHVDTEATKIIMLPMKFRMKAVAWNSDELIRKRE